GGNAKVNAIHNPNPERFPFPAYSGYKLLLTRPTIIFCRDMEQYIRDKYERKLFMSAEYHKSLSHGPSRKSIPNAAVVANSAERKTSPERYPLQLKSLKEMGFIDQSANAETLSRTGGNLQQTIEILLSNNISAPQREKPSENSKSSVDDLASLFGI